MTKQILLSALAALYLLPLASFGQERMVERNLRQLVEQEERILGASQRADGSYDEDMLERRFQGLVHEYDAFIQKHDEYAPGYVAYARLLERIGQERAARAMYMKANQLDPNIPLVKNQLGNYLAEEEKFAQALPYYLAAIELDPEESLYHFQLGNLLHHFQDDFVEDEIFTRTVIDEKMIEAFRKAAELSPDEMVFVYRFAEAFYDLEDARWEEALEAWDQVERKAAPGIEAEAVILHRANVALKQGKTERARELLETVEQPLLQRQKATLEKELDATAAEE